MVSSVVSPAVPATPETTTPSVSRCPEAVLPRADSFTAGEGLCPSSSFNFNQGNGAF